MVTVWDCPVTMIASNELAPTHYMPLRSLPAFEFAVPSTGLPFYFTISHGILHTLVLESVDGQVMTFTTPFCF